MISLIGDPVLLPLFENLVATNFSKIIVVPQTAEPLPKEYLNYEVVLAGSDEQRFELFEGNENEAAFMCYTSGTTGRPKGVLYSHRSIVLHSMAFLLSCSGGGIVEQDVVLPVPMFHAAAGAFHSAALLGATVFPVPTDADNLLHLLKASVTVTGGVPTVLRNILLIERDARLPLNSLRLVVFGGARGTVAD
jgi:fatty-acyl-CoA synthase